MRELAEKIWHFLWHEDSAASWIANAVLAFLIIKFLVYPGLGLLLGTPYPVVAVMSSSMEHDLPFERWWASQAAFYERFNLSREAFENFPFKNGFNRGDIMLLIGIKAEKLKPGDVLVYRAATRDPIIHRVIAARRENGEFVFETKGDHNPGQIKSESLDESAVREQAVLGKAVFRIPLLGWIKIAFVALLRLFGLA